MAEIRVGYLNLFTRLRNKWNRRFFTLSETELSYRTSKDVPSSHIAAISLSGATFSEVSASNGQDYVFTVTPATGSALQISARTLADAQAWLIALAEPTVAATTAAGVSGEGDVEDQGEESTAKQSDGPTIPAATAIPASSSASSSASGASTGAGVGAGAGAGADASGQGLGLGLASPSGPMPRPSLTPASPAGAGGVRFGAGGNDLLSTPRAGGARSPLSASGTPSGATSPSAANSRALTYVSPLQMLISAQADTSSYKIACRHTGPLTFESKWRVKLVSSSLKNTRDYLACFHAPSRQLYLFNSDREATVYSATGKRTYSQLVELNGGVLLPSPSYGWAGGKDKAGADVAVIEILLPSAVFFFSAETANDLSAFTRVLHDMALLPFKTPVRAEMIKGQPHCASVLGKHGFLDVKVDKKKFKRSFFRTIENARGAQVLAEFSNPTEIEPKSFVFLLWPSGEGPVKLLRGLPPGDAWAASHPDEESKCLTLFSGAVRLCLRAESEAERDEWLSVLLSISCDDFMTAPTGKTSTVDFYAVLGVPAVATPQDISNAFRQLAKLVHPDRNSAPEAASHFQRLNEAYEILSDPVLRREYDVQHAAMSQRKAAALAAGSATGSDGVPVMDKTRPNRMPLVPPTSTFVTPKPGQTLITHEKLQSLIAKHQKQATKLGNPGAEFVMPTVANIRLAGTEVGFVVGDDEHNEAEAARLRAVQRQAQEDAAARDAAAREEARKRREAEEARLRAEEEAKEAARKQRLEEERQRRLQREREEAEARRKAEEERLRRLAMDPIDRPLPDDLLATLATLGAGVPVMRVPDSMFSKPSELSLRLVRAPAPTDSAVTIYCLVYTSVKDKVDRKTFVVPEVSFEKVAKAKLPKEMAGRESAALTVSPDDKKVWGPKASTFVFSDAAARDAVYDAVQAVLASMAKTAEKQPHADGARRFVAM